MIDYIGVFFLIAWAVNIWAFLIVLAARPGLVKTVLWAAILLVPLVGFVVWFLLGPRAKTA